MLIGLWWWSAFPLAVVEENQRGSSRWCDRSTPDSNNTLRLLLRGKIFVVIVSTTTRDLWVDGIMACRIPCCRGCCCCCFKDDNRNALILVREMDWLWNRMWAFVCVASFYAAALDILTHCRRLLKRFLGGCGCCFCIVAVVLFRWTALLGG
jgi:hypothetical protein